MESDLRDELLHLITYERGATTKQLFAAIVVMRKPEINLWHHKQPVDEAGLQLLLFSLQSLGQIVNEPGLGWVIMSQVAVTKRRTFDEQVQGVMF